METPLHILARDPKNLETMNCLIHRGAWPNFQDCDGNTPLHLASGIRAGSSIVKFLLDANADPTLENNAGENPLGVVHACIGSVVKPERGPTIKFRRQMDYEKTLVLLRNSMQAPPPPPALAVTG
jgi:hypothetical protein